MKNAIAITGGYGCGKSAVGDILKNLGYAVVDSDTLAREAVTKGSKGLKDIVARFGESILLPSGELDRKKLAQIVFSDTKSREDLEAILHPLIREAWLKIYNSFNGEFIFYLIPLLFESKQSYPEISKSVTVHSSLENIIKRSSLSPEEVNKRLSAQLPIEEKIKRADFSIENNGTINDLEIKVKELLRCL